MLFYVAPLWYSKINSLSHNACLGYVDGAKIRHKPVGVLWFLYKEWVVKDFNKKNDIVCHELRQWYRHTYVHYCLKWLTMDESPDRQTDRKSADPAMLRHGQYLHITELHVNNHWWIHTLQCLNVYILFLVMHWTLLLYIHWT